MEMSVSPVNEVPCSDADNASAVHLRHVHRGGQCKGVFADQWFEEQDRPFALHLVSVCRERLARHPGNGLVEFALRLSLAQTTPQRCQKGKTPMQLERED